MVSAIRSASLGERTLPSGRRRSALLGRLARPVPRLTRTPSSRSRRFSFRAAASSGFGGVVAAREARVVGEARERAQLSGCIDPAGRHPAAAVEDGVVGADGAGDAPDSRLADVARQVGDPGQREVVAPREAQAGEGGIASPDDHQAALERVPVPGVPSPRVQPGLQPAVGAEAVEHGSGREQLRVRGQDATRARRPAEQDAVARRVDVHHPGAARAARALHLVAESVTQPGARDGAPHPRARAGARTRAPPARSQTAFRAPSGRVAAALGRHVPGRCLAKRAAVCLTGAA